MTSLSLKATEALDKLLAAKPFLSGYIPNDYDKHKLNYCYKSVPRKFIDCSAGSSPGKNCCLNETSYLFGTISKANTIRSSLDLNGIV